MQTDNGRLTRQAKNMKKITGLFQQIFMAAAPVKTKGINTITNKNFEARLL
jgi:hypothetical protein